MAAALPLVPESCVNPSQRLQLVGYGSGYSRGQLVRYRSLRGQVTVAYPVRVLSVHVCTDYRCLGGGRKLVMIREIFSILVSYIEYLPRLVAFL